MLITELITTHLTLGAFGGGGLRRAFRSSQLLILHTFQYESIDICLTV